MSDEAKVLLRVGDVLHGPNGERALVGDLNVLGGVCDDCRHDAIRAYDRFERGWSVGSNVLDDLSSRRWTPVSERLPEEGVPVLALCQSGGYQFQSVCYWHGGWRAAESGAPCDAVKITHWQPLPEPPKP